MKKFLSLLLMLSILFMPLDLYHDNSSVSAAETIRYTALVIDNSGSMNGKAIEVAKGAAKKFCQTVLSSSGTNYISVIRFESSASSLCTFTDNLATLELAIDKMYASGGTSAKAGLVTAETMLQSVTDAAIHNIVLMSDGDASDGVSKAEELKTAGYNIYTLGFFHSGSKTTAKENILRSIQNKGYIEVTDLDKLEFGFGEISDLILDESVKESWVNQHKRFIKSEDYKNYITDGFIEGLMDIANSDIGNTSVTTYNSLNTMQKFLGKTNWGYVDEYEFLIAQLMINEGNYVGIKENFMANLTQSLSDCGKYAVEFFEDTVMVASNEDELVKSFDALKKAYNGFMNAELGSQAFFTNLKTFGGLLDNNLNLTNFKKFMVSKKGDILSSITAITMNTVSEVFLYISYGQAYKQTSSDFKNILVLIKYQLQQNYLDVGEDGLRFLDALINWDSLDKAIDNIITNCGTYESDGIKAVASYAMSALKEETLGEITDVAISATLKLIPVLRVFGYLRDDLEKGMDFINILTTWDDYAYAGNTVARLYYMNKILYDVVDQCADALSSVDSSDLDSAFFKASLFDEAINFYKNSTCLACDYASKFEQETLKGELNKLYPNKKKISWYSTAVVIAEAQKLKYLDLECHSDMLSYDHKTTTPYYNQSGGYKLFLIACPVAVTIKDTSGSQIAYLSDEVENVAEGYSQYFKVINSGTDRIKLALVPESYNVSVSGMGTGIMNAYVSNLNSINGINIDSTTVYENVDVTADTIGEFKISDNGNLYINNIKVNAEESIEYDMTHAITKNDVTVMLDKSSYSFDFGEDLVINSRIVTDDEYVAGSHKYIGWCAYLHNGAWEQLNSWWVDGGTCDHTIRINTRHIGELSNVIFAVSLFPADKFATGYSLCDKVCQISIKNGYDVDSYGNLVAVGFDAQGGICEDYELTRRTSLSYGYLPVAKRDGYTFDGWYTEKNGSGNKLKDSYNVTSSKDFWVYANWIKNTEYSISYNLDGGQAENPAIYDGSYSISLNRPIKSGYKFLGWTGSNGNVPQENVIISKGTTENLSYTANWESLLVSHSVTYNLLGGVLNDANVTSYMDFDLPIVLNNPTRKGYEFLGWTGSNGTVPQAGLVVFSGGSDLSYTANWQLASAEDDTGQSSETEQGEEADISYAISYNLNGGENVNNYINYNQASLPMTLNNPTKIGYIFLGWTGSNGTVPSKSVTIFKGETGNKFYTANWKKIETSSSDSTQERWYLGQGSITLNKTKYMYTGKAIKPTPTVKVNGKTLVNGKDYNVYYYNNKNVGVGTVRIIGINDYMSWLETDFKILPKSTKITKLISGKKKLTVKWKKSSGVTTYKVQYSTNKRFKGAKTINVKGTRKVITKLKSKKKYYIRIKAYKGSVASGWSDAKSIKVK